MKIEYERIGLTNSSRLLRLDNQDFTYCDTYPKVLYIPIGLEPQELKEVCNFRSRSRIPAVTWKLPGADVFLLRCAQPCVGFKSMRSSADEKLLTLCKAENQPLIHILDSRPKTNAVANMLRGGGYEMTKYYKDILLEFNNIENIHVIRSSFLAVHQFCQNSTDAAQLMNITSSNLPPELQESKWFDHKRYIFESASRVMDLMLKENHSVLIHCSDGWDRTSQTASLAQILLDPFYRTIEGFIRIIEKDWLQFGHQFALRHGFVGGKIGNYKDSQRSPIFPQFLDCVYQFFHLFPNAFEWNETFLLLLMDELYACRFGTFLESSQKQRDANHLFTLTRSCWKFIQDRLSVFTNREFVPREEALFLPPTEQIEFKLWVGYYAKFMDVTSYRYHDMLTCCTDSENRSKRKVSSRRSKSRRNTNNGMVRPTDALPAVSAYPPSPVTASFRVHSHKLSVTASDSRTKEKSSHSRRERKKSMENPPPVDPALLNPISSPPSQRIRTKKTRKALNASKRSSGSLLETSAEAVSPRALAGVQASAENSHRVTISENPPTVVEYSYKEPQQTFLPRVRVTVALEEANHHPTPPSQNSTSDFDALLAAMDSAENDDQN